MRAPALRCAGAVLLVLAATASAQAPVPPKTQPAAACQHSVVGTLQLLPLTGKVFTGERMLRVWLPPGYAASGERRYPVLYVLDGQNAFDTCTGYMGHEWMLDEVATRLIANGTIPPLVIVAIDNAGARRANEYLPVADPFNPTDGAMEGDRLATFLASDVMPAVTARYRVSANRDDIALGGFSYGGVATLHVALTNPQLIGKALIESPSLQVGNGQLLRDAADAAVLPDRVYIGMGGAEQAVPDGVPDAMRERMAKNNAGLVDGARRLRNRLAGALVPATVKLVIDPDAHHGEEAWAKRLPAALAFLFGTDLASRAHPVR